MINYSDEVQKQLKDSLKILKSILGSDLLGVYLFGSAVMGGLQKYSDLDLFVVANRQITSEEKTKLTTRLLQISGIYMKNVKPPIEMTIVEKKNQLILGSILLILIFNTVNGYANLLKRESLTRGKLRICQILRYLLLKSC